MKHGSMFSGIEGFGLGLRLAGWPVETVWQSEIDPFCREVLAARFPDTLQLGNIVDVADDEIPECELLTAGFPCQPVSQAGLGRAQDDPRWLWPHVARVIRVVRPSLVICENVRGLRSRGLSLVLADLARLGYNAQWDLLPAAAVGAPHLRHRFWIVAYPADKPMGRVFGRKPPVFPWEPEEHYKPRLVRRSPRRRERLTALGNAVVPHAVAGVALNISVAGETWGDDAWMIGGSNRATISSFDGRPPVSGALIDGQVCSLPTSAPTVKGARLWPTAAANDGEWSLEAIMACVDKHGAPARDPHERHYHPVTGQIVQRGLHNYVLGVEAGLWPTPLTGGLWPTASATDYKGVSQPGQRRGQLEEAVKTEERLWPTPVTSGGGQRARSVERATARMGEEHSFQSLADAAMLAEADPEGAPSGLNPRWVAWLMGYPDGWLNTLTFVPEQGVGVFEETAA